MKEHSHETHPAYSSFFFGLILGAAGLYLVGTKHGRTMLKKLMDAAEQFDDVGENLIMELQEKAKEDFDLESFIDHLNQKKQREEDPITNIHSVMERIKSVIPTKEVKKYVSKDGKILK